MRQRWSLNIKGFGKIKTASVKIAPMVIFVGENNSGKSYLVSLLWGVMARGRSIFPKEPPASEAYRRCSALLRQRPVTVNTEFQNALVEWFNSLLKSRKNDLVREIFAHKDIGIEHLSISDYVRDRPLSLKWDIKPEAGSWRISASQSAVRFPVVEGEPDSEAEVYRRLQYLAWKLIMGELSAPLFPPGLSNQRRAEGETLYLPAVRSGFMLTYRSLAAEVMGAWSGEEVNSTFTLPVVRFLQGLANNRPSTKARLLHVAEYLEDKILHGHVKTARAAINDYTYVPQGGAALPYHLTSSLVGELTPLVIFLRSNITYRSLILEEPEAHLHPELQKQLTCALSRIVSAGVPVWCTTHSETVFQQVNNLMRLYSHPERETLMEAYGYQQEDLLAPEDVMAYQFVAGPNGTCVEPLEQTADGFAVPTFNNALVRLAEETLAFSRDD
ncbi:AAA family ATPase [Oceanimonas sp. CAM02]|uniref:AAA family ATPase n=1 Tax=Oceanimonas sp. CAM02 TaxID=3080336 RepID=UPI0029356344|nr:AAA family ATPase [Oceanimonas sp. CAM02]MDV2857167.1 AAA family ATPase [Oceanimonas sp. CAM02]